MEEMKEEKKPKKETTDRPLKEKRAIHPTTEGGGNMQGGRNEGRKPSVFPLACQPVHCHPLSPFPSLLSAC